MLLACLAALLCLLTGVTGVIMACVDISRFTFGLYLALLSVIGSTVSVAFWMVKPEICENPKCVQRITNGFRKSLSANFDSLRKEQSSNCVACSNERGLTSSDGFGRHASSNLRRQPKKRCSYTVTRLPFRNQKLLRTKCGVRRSSTWCSINDGRHSTFKLDKNHKKLSWRDGYSNSDDIQLFDAHERPIIKPCGDLPECSDRHVEEGIAKTLAPNLTLPPVSIAQAHSLPKVHQCTEIMKASRSLTFIRRLLIHDKEVGGNESSKLSDATEESVYCDRPATFEFRFIPRSWPSDEPTADSWITRSFSSESSWKYQLLEKTSSSQSLSTLV